MVPSRALLNPEPLLLQPTIASALASSQRSLSPSFAPPPPTPPDDVWRVGIRLTKDFAEALFPGKRIASVLAIADKSHGFIYLVIPVLFRASAASPHMRKAFD
jgi:hypothetical protein